MALAGCGESILSSGSDETRTDREAVTVVPQFELTGAEKLPDELVLDNLGLAVTEIDLTPVDGTEGVAYTNREPVGIEFDVQSGKTVRTGRELVLPESGKFDVSLRLEPVELREDAEGTNGEYSFRVAGAIAGDAVVRVDSTSDGDDQDGDPIPFPASPERTSDESDDGVSDNPELPKQWTPFEYATDKSVVYTLDEVEFVGGKQALTFTFDAREWSVELVEPLARAVQRTAVENESVTESTSVVDVTREIDKRGEGPEALADHVSVRTERPGGGHGGL